MDWDEAERPSKRDTTIGEDLSNLSVEELHHRIKALKTEIDRVEVELERKRALEAAANDVFKS